jgi:hypothetical protein
LKEMFGIHWLLLAYTMKLWWVDECSHRIRIHTFYSWYDVRGFHSNLSLRHLLSGRFRIYYLSFCWEKK